MDNIILLTDSYKLTHFKQYPKGTTEVYSYFESRGGKWDETTFFGLQYILKKYLVGQVVTKEKIDQAEAIYNIHMAQPDGEGGFFCPCEFNRAGWEYILDKHGGHLPLSIKAVPEGTTVPTKNVLMTVINTDPECFWLTNYVETLLVEVWYPMTVCTNSREQKKVIHSALDKTGTPDFATSLGFKLHDFGFRGVSSVESAGLGGAAHLVNFMGTDTVAALMLAQEFYGPSDLVAGYSIPASEHSTITSWTQEGETDAMRNMLTQYKSGLVACVSDSFDIYKACSEKWGKELKEEVLARKGTLVVRPDSGEPKKIVVECLEKLGKAFGAPVNDKGYKVLPPQVRLIQGDGVSLESLIEILAAMKKKKWSADNVAFGSGGALLQKLNRDTSKCAFKCSSITVDGKAREVFKDPITDKGKKSKKGYLSLVKKGDNYSTVESASSDAVEGDILVEVFRDGKLLVDHSFEDVRKAAAYPAA